MSREDKKFWLGAFLCLAGVAMMFVDLFIPPVGELSEIVLWGVGEIFTLAGGLLGLDAYFDFKLKRFVSNDKNKEKDDGDSV